MTNRPLPPATDVELDVRALLMSLVRALPYLIVLLVAVAIGTFLLLSRVTPIYKSEATILIQSGESSLTRTADAGGDAGAVLDEQAIASQVQLIRSRDLARRVAAKLDLQSRPEYQKAVAGRSILNDLLARFGLARNPVDSSVEERVLALYYDRLQVSTLEKSRVIAIDFSSADPKLAADAANAIANAYIDMQRAAKRDTTADATKWLESEIADLRTKVKDAEAKVETYRSQQGLFQSDVPGGGQTAVTLPEQQLSDLNAELTKVKAARADAEAKAAQIRAGITTGSVPNLTDVLNSQLIQRLSEQVVALKAQMAQLSATFLPGHPRMQELAAQIKDLDRQISAEAQKILDSVEAEAKLSKAREDEIARSLDQMKATAATANDAGVQLRALEREAAAQRDLLDTYLRRYREALARQNGDYLPADARIVSAAAVAIEPDFPKKIPMTAAASVAILILAVAFVLIRELASGRPMREVRIEPLPVVPDEKPIGGHVRWADDRGIRRMMPSEPTLAPEMESEVERSLGAIAERIVKEGRGRVMVTLADGSDESGRPLAAVALTRALAKLDKRAVLLDLHNDGADSVTMGDGADLPGFTDLYAGDASFAQVIFRDRRSRAHFIPSGRKPFPANLSGDLVNTVLSALDHTYDHLIVDAGEEFVELIAPTAAAAVVVSEFGAADPRTIRAFDRITDHSSATIMLLVVDALPAPATAPDAETPAAAERPERPAIAAADEAAA
jgi:uncharacterized protein involved in exopolysaccharide biosynthesis/Mrp family chromosome partitioning ATPase